MLSEQHHMESQDGICIQDTQTLYNTVRIDGDAHQTVTTTAQRATTTAYHAADTVTQTATIVMTAVTETTNTSPTPSPTSTSVPPPISSRFITLPCY